MTQFAGKVARVLVLSGLTAVLLAVSAMAADIAVGVGATTGSSLRMRSGASTSSSVITMLDKGVAVAILDDSNPDWYRVSYDGDTGYISADYLIVDQDNRFECYGAANANGVCVRAGASTDSEILATITKDTIVTVNGFENGWYDVTCE